MNRVASFGVATPRAGAEPIIVGLRYNKDPGRGNHLSQSQLLESEWVLLVSLLWTVNSDHGHDQLL
jgi:hypothetical protein